jgi:DnaK suppressor protein
MKPLTRQQTTRLRHLLDQREAATRTALAREGAQRSNESFSELATPVGDEGERASAQQAVDENLAITAHLARELGAVAQARVRLDAGKYGVCVDCHRDISFPRLLACPTAQRCEHCQTIHDRTYGQESHPSM